MKIKQILLSAGIYGRKSVRALVIAAALIPFALSAIAFDFSISISPSQIVIPPGGTANYTITVTGPTTTPEVTFALSGLPPESSASIAKESATTYSLTITTSRSTRQGEYVFTVTATSGGMSASASAKLIVLLG